MIGIPGDSKEDQSMPTGWTGEGKPQAGGPWERRRPRWPVSRGVINRAPTPLMAQTMIMVIYTLFRPAIQGSKPVQTR